MKIQTVLLIDINKFDNLFFKQNIFVQNSKSASQSADKAKLWILMKHAIALLACTSDADYFDFNMIDCMG